MFHVHQPRIAAHAQTPEGLQDVITFAICTIQRHFYYVQTITDAVRRDGVDAVPTLTGQQKKAIATLPYLTPRLLCDIRDIGSHNDIALMSALLEVPGLGYAKAGFVAQMVCGRVGCLDIHHLRRLGLSPRTFTRVPATVEYLTPRIEAYLTACRLLGTPEQLWDTWCDFIAHKYPTLFTDAHAVSAYHVRCVVGREP